LRRKIFESTNKSKFKEITTDLKNQMQPVLNGGRVLEEMANKILSHL
jgi:hypothetical protein